MPAKTNYELAAKAWTIPGMRYFAKDKSGEWYAYAERPEKTYSRWLPYKINGEETDYRYIGFDNGLTSELNWETSIYLLKEFDKISEFNNLPSGE